MEAIRLIDCNEYLYELLSLADVSFGQSYLTEADFLAKGTKVWAAFREDLLIGFFLCREVDESVFTQMDVLPFQDHPKSPLVHVKSIAVLPNYRLQGVATALLNAGLAYYREKGFRFMFAELWQKGQLVPAAKLFEREGFVVLKPLPRFWFQHSLEHGYICDVCGEPPCCCNAVLYGLTVASGESA